MDHSQGWGSFIWEKVGIPWPMIPIIIASAALMYLALMLIIRVFGTRFLSSTSFSSTIGIVMLGSLAGRSILGATPTLTAGILALITLVAMESVFHTIEHSAAARFVPSTRPVLVFLDGEALEEPCRRTHTCQVDLNSAMRGAGVSSPQDVRCIILEPNGHYSVIRTGLELNPNLFTYVDGVEKIFANGQ